MAFDLNLTEIGSHISGGKFVIGTSGTQFPNSAGFLHKIKIMQSSVVFVAGDASVNSGTGYILAGDPATSPSAKMDAPVNNLNKVYGIALTSTPATYISFNF